jgi:septal ring factor EnvC (AmiA/AmiB activator)
MNNGTARAIGLFSALLLPMGCFAAQSGAAPAASSGALQKQLQHTRAELHSQRTQTDQLRTRVKDLEKTSAADRAALEQRDREIRELRRKLAALPAAADSAPIRPAGH